MNGTVPVRCRAVESGASYLVNQRRHVPIIENALCDTIFAVIYQIVITEITLKNCPFRISMEMT
jgi:hypothetical protein